VKDDDDPRTDVERFFWATYRRMYLEMLNEVRATLDALEAELNERVPQTTRPPTRGPREG
jgi:hypothetical protein